MYDNEQTTNQEYYEEEEYARTVLEAKKIMKDPKKWKMAQAGAKRMAEKKTIELKALKQIANKKHTMPVQ